jgi:hypothetical protein
MFDVFYQGPKPNLFPFELPANTLEQAAELSRTKFFWFIDGNFDYANFDFTWRPVPWESDYVHVFPSQWQRDGHTYFVNSNKIYSYQWYWRTEQKVNAKQTANIVYIDHGNNDFKLSWLKEQYPSIKVTRFIDSYLGTIKRILNSVDADYIWVVNSICDYTTFDFSWHPDRWQEQMLHVFPSNGQTKGDTFYVNVREFKRQADQIELLDWFDTIHYCSDQQLTRYPAPIEYYNGNNLISAVKLHTFNFPYTVFSDRIVDDYPKDYCMWSLKDRSVMPLTQSNSVSLVPRDIKTYLDTQIYDYPYILKTKTDFLEPKMLDIIYISNGEPDAERWYNHLLNTAQRPVKRILNVNGRSNAYKAAAATSETSWFFAVPAKLEVIENFDWNWQPDLLQEPKHYIFHAKNPVNGLTYGHMAMVAYNKELVLDTIVYGLDFTMSKQCAVIPKISGTAHYNTTPELTWRTAFRECIKLYDDVNKTGSVESQHRLETWLSEAQGEHAMWSLLGARDAIDYWNTCEGKHEFLMLTFEWKWLSEYYAKIYTPNPTFNGDYIDESHQQPIQLPGRLALGR